MIKELFEEGQAKILKAEAELEKTKAGKLRAGNSGLLTADGKTIQSCRAQTYLRYKGISADPTTPSRDLMFDGGRRNEDHWADVLAESWNGVILREEEIATRWETDFGVAVTGRPDIVLCNTESKPVAGIELKQCCSLWTTRDILVNKKPKLAHLIQSAHYSWQLGIPYELWYTSRVDYAVTGDWIKRMFPKFGEDKSENFDYGFYKLGEINPRTEKPIRHRITKEEYIASHQPDEWVEYYDKVKDKTVREPKYQCEVLKVLPFVQGYQLDLSEGQLFYRDAMASDSPWIATHIKIADLERFYNSIPVLDKVPKEPELQDCNGDKLSYKASQYCSLGLLCCKYNEGRDINEWVSDVEASLNS